MTFRFWPLCLLLVFLACGTRPTQESCRKSTDCQRKGLCTLRDGACIAASREDCEQSRFCINLGECSANAGRCLAVKEEDCRNSTQCKEAKKCVPSGGVCIEIDTFYCKNHSDCADQGLCSLDSRTNTCVARRAQDCSASQQCSLEGMCSLDEQTRTCTIQSNADCQGSQRCTKQGRCNIAGPLGARKCVPQSTQDCRDSEECPESLDGNCAFDRQQEACVHPRDFCKSACEQRGECSWDARGFCVVRTDADCAKSALCTLERKCKAVGGRCISATDLNRCAQTAVCAKEGACTYKNEQCIAASDADCRRSENCWKLGLCKADRGACVFDSCDGPDGPCERYGRCSEINVNGQRICTATSNSACQSSTICKLFGLCRLRDNVCSFAGSCETPCKQNGRCKAGRDNVPTIGTVDTCVATKTEECQASAACKQYGQCVFQNGRCAATTCDGEVCSQYGNCQLAQYKGIPRCGPVLNAHCAQSQACLQSGLCQLYEGRCAPGTDKHCESSSACRSEGYCGYNEQTKTCMPKNDTDCRLYACRLSGKCKVQWNTEEKRFRCAPTLSEHCAGSEQCKNNNLCTFQNGACTRDADCATACARFGLCQKNDSNGSFTCQARSDEDCRKSLDCTIHGYCKLQNGRCAALSDSDCQGSLDCHVKGLCSFQSGACVLTSCGSDTTACTRYGRCATSEGNNAHCVADSDENCKKSTDCLERGLCAKEDGGERCVNTSCTDACTTYGRCQAKLLLYRASFNSGESFKICAAVTDADCQNSTKCTEGGLCRLQNNGCVALSNDDCRKSTKCTQEGLCTLKNGTCQLTSSADCARSDMCRKDGACALVDGTCEPTTFAHCQNSTGCTIDGSCRLSDGLCVAEVTSCGKSADCYLRGYCRYDPRTEACIFSGCDGETCRRSGRCQESTEAGKKTCIATDIKKCLASLDCQERGLCILIPGETVCSFKDCNQEPCTRYGRCTASQTTYLGTTRSVCIADSEDDCSSSETCTQNGNCHLLGDSCVAKSKDDCTDSTQCKENGACSFKDNACKLLSDDDCQKSQQCRYDGACKFQGDRCVVKSPVDCKASLNCTRYGRCVTAKIEVQRPGAGGAGENSSGGAGEDSGLPPAGEPVPISNHEVPPDGGNIERRPPDGGATGEMTVPDGGQANPDQASPPPRVDLICSANTCDQTTEACKIYGRCTLNTLPNGSKACIASSDATCKASERCKTHGQCRLVSNNCQAASNQECASACKLYGRCVSSPIDNIRTCVAFIDQHCLNSEICKSDGKCAKDPQGTDCHAATQASCQTSTNCREKGRCVIDSTTHSCIAGADKDCANSTGCLNDGLCSRKDNTCVAASNTDCEGSQRCKTSGFCTNLGDACYVQKTEDCTNSSDCKTKGLCRLSNGACVK